jgi:CubicO group peptidase (beta-lactamase class C family)
MLTLEQLILVVMVQVRANRNDTAIAPLVMIPVGTAIGSSGSENRNASSVSSGKSFNHSERSTMTFWHVLRSIVFVFVLPALACAQGPRAISAQELKDLAARVRELVEDDEAVGAEVLVLERRQVVLHEAFGWSDMDRKTPLAPNMIMCVRSMTKPLVGTAIQMLIDDGKLRASDAASKYLDSFDNEKSRAITIEQLLTHTAGFPLTLIDKPLRSYAGQRAVVDQAGKIGPSGKSGSFRYSDTDSETLAAIVSEVSGGPVDEFIRRRIIEPLGMKDTFCVLGNDSPPRSRVSSNHAGAPGMWHKYWDREAKPFFPFFLGAAALYSTTTDYARFLGLWMDRGKVGGRRLLSEAAIERALNPSQPMLSPGSNTPYPTALAPLKPFYGQHWMVYPSRKVTEAKTLPVFGHGGSDGTLALVFPERDLIVCYFTQSRGGMSTFRFEELIAPLVGLNRPSARHRMSAEELQPLLGDYLEKSSGKRAWVTAHGRRLRIELAGQAALLPLWPDDSGRWAFGEGSPGVSVSFAKTSTGGVTNMRLLYNDKPLIVYERATNDPDLPTVQHIMAFRREKQGGDRIDELKALEMTGKLNVGSTKMEVTVIAAAGPDRVVRRVVSPEGVATAIFDGKRAFRQSPGAPAEEEFGVKLDEAKRMSPIARLRDWRESSSAVRVAGKTRIDGEDVWVLRVECEFEPPLTRYVSIKSGLLKKEEGWITASGLGTVPISIRMDDFRDVAGVKVPFRSTSDSALTGKQTFQLTEAKANPPISEKTFAVPEG